MIVNSVTLYQTPLDIEHSKVIDIIGGTKENIMDTYNEALDNYTKLLLYDNDYSKSIKIINKRCELTVSRNYLFLLDYNYCKINDKYFFIEQITSNNDSNVNPSSTLSLIWDYWANNLVELLTTSNNNCVITNRHINRFRGNDMIYYTNDDIKISNIENTINPTDNYKVLFLKLTMSRSMFKTVTTSEGISLNNVLKFYCSTYDYNGNEVNLTGTDLLPDTVDNVIDLYVPLSVLDCGNEKFLSNIGLYVTIYKDGAPYIVKFNTFRGKPSFSFRSTVSEEILNAILTYHCPYYYYYNEEMNGIIFTNALAITNHKMTEIEGYTQFGDYIHTFFGFGTSNLRVNKNINFNYEDYITNYNAPNIIKDIYSDDNGFDPKLHIYPFNYIKLHTPDDDIIISPNRKSFKNVNIKINSEYSDSPSYVIYVDNKAYSSCIRNYINDTPSVSFSTLSIDDYNLRNGTQNKVSDSLAMLNTGVRYISSVTNPKTYISSTTDMLTSLASTVESRRAILTDKSNLPDIIHSPPLGEYDTINCDRFILIYCSICDCKYYDTMKEMFRIYGYEIDIDDDPFKNYRVWYDYVKTNNCKLINTINLNDRVELENMFNRGVHKFHIHTSNTKIFKDDLSFSTASHNNIELTFMEGE